jgi:F-box protein 21
MAVSLDLLPEEILHCIILYALPQDAAAISQASRRLNRVVEHPLLWLQYCQRFFKFWDEHYGIEQKFNAPLSSTDWKNLYVRRHNLDRETTRAINQIIKHQSGRIRRIESIVQNGYDVKDTLIRHSLAGEDTEDYLARRSVYSMPCTRLRLKHQS